MNKILSLICCLCVCAASALAGGKNVKIKVVTPGTLTELLKGYADNEIKGLSVTGTLNANDVQACSALPDATTRRRSMKAACWKCSTWEKPRCERFSFLHWREDGGVFFEVAIVFLALAIDFEEAFKLDDFSVGHEAFVA